MKAAVYTKFGSPGVIQIKEIGKPVPKKNQVLIKVHAGTVTAGDCVMRKAPFPLNLIFSLLLPRQKISGIEISGVVEAVGKDITQFKPGDEVFGATGFHMGCNAEYNCAVPKSLAIKPANISYEEAAALPVGGITSIHYLRDKAEIQKDQSVLIHGSSGSVGTYAVQLAKYYGARVTGLCSTPNIELVKSLGADSIIDYTKENFTGSETRYDVIFDAAGKISYSKCKKALAKGGKFISVNQGLARVRPENLAFLKELVELGKIRAVIDRTYSLDQTPEAHHYVEQGHKKGNVVIKIN